MNLGEHRQFIEIILSGGVKPYYEIKYRDLNTMEVRTGFGSYNIKVISDYIREYFIDEPKDEIEINNTSVESDEEEKSNILLQGSGNPWLTDKNKTVPKKCPICGADMGLFLIGEPVFLCEGKDRHYYGTLKFVPDTEE